MKSGCLFPMNLAECKITNANDWNEIITGKSTDYVCRYTQSRTHDFTSSSNSIEAGVVEIGKQKIPYNTENSRWLGRWSCP
jgi:ribosome modulation factor